MQQPFVLSAQEVLVTASIGVSLSAAEGQDLPKDLLGDADVAVYRVKGRGKNDHPVFDPYLDKVARVRL